MGYQRETDGIPVTELPEPDRNTIIPLTLTEIRHTFATHLGVIYHYLRRIAAAQAATTQISLSLPYWAVGEYTRY